MVENARCNPTVAEWHRQHGRHEVYANPNKKVPIPDAERPRRCASPRMPGCSPAGRAVEPACRQAARRCRQPHLARHRSEVGLQSSIPARSVPRGQPGQPGLDLLARSPTTVTVIRDRSQPPRPPPSPRRWPPCESTARTARRCRRAARTARAAPGRGHLARRLEVPGVAARQRRRAPGPAPRAWRARAADRLSSSAPRGWRPRSRRSAPPPARRTGPAPRLNSKPLRAP